MWANLPWRTAFYGRRARAWPIEGPPRLTAPPPRRGIQNGRGCLRAAKPPANTPSTNKTPPSPPPRRRGWGALRQGPTDGGNSSLSAPEARPRVWPFAAMAELRPVAGPARPQTRRRCTLGPPEKAKRKERAGGNTWEPALPGCESEQLRYLFGVAFRVRRRGRLLTALPADISVMPGHGAPPRVWLCCRTLC